MRLPAEIVEALNRQLNLEFASAYFYLGVVPFFERRNLTGFAAWMRAQYREELDHAQRIFEFLVELDGEVRLADIPAPRIEAETPAELFRAVLAHEEKVTRSIYELYEAARTAGAHAAVVMLEWFINEQVEEEATVRTILGQLELAGDNPAALLMLDREVAATRGEAATE